MRRQKNGEDGVFVFLPFMTSPDDLPESYHDRKTSGGGYGVLVNVGWVPIEEYKTHGLRNFKLPESENIDIINNELGKRYFERVNF